MNFVFYVYLMMCVYVRVMCVESSSVQWGIKHWYDTLNALSSVCLCGACVWVYGWVCLCVCACGFVDVYL